jgi:hypothetical protein
MLCVMACSWPDSISTASFDSSTPRSEPLDRFALHARRRHPFGRLSRQRSRSSSSIIITGARNGVRESGPRYLRPNVRYPGTLAYLGSLHSAFI